MENVNSNVADMSLLFSQILSIVEDDSSSLVPEYIGILKLKKSELSGVSKEIKSFLKAQNYAITYRKRKERENYVYEIRFRRGKFNLSVSAFNLALAKSRFIERLVNFS